MPPKASGSKKRQTIQTPYENRNVMEKNPRNWSTHEVFDLETTGKRRDSNRLVAKHSRTYGKVAGPALACSASSELLSGRWTLGAMVELERRRYDKKLRAKVRAWLNLFGPRVVDFEISIRIRSLAWMSPSMECLVRTVNVRPWGCPIFQACEFADLKRVKFLLESGEASINDVCPDGNSLLWVSPRS